MTIPLTDLKAILDIIHPIFQIAAAMAVIIGVGIAIRNMENSRHFQIANSLFNHNKAIFDDPAKQIVIDHFHRSNKPAVRNVAQNLENSDEGIHKLY